MKTVGELMSTDLIAVEPTATVSEAAALMGSRKAGSVVVLQDGKLLGIFTERDVIRALAAYFDAAKHPVEEWMARDPKTVGPGTAESEALNIMLDNGFRHLPVVDGGSVVGMISIRDVSHHSAG